MHERDRKESIWTKTNPGGNGKTAFWLHLVNKYMDLYQANPDMLVCKPEVPVIMEGEGEAPT